MTIKEVCTRYGLSQDTLRYYEKIGVIPEVARSSGGIRNYTEEDIGWIKNAICMRSAGMPVEKLVEYVRLTKLGDGTFEARRNLLLETKEEILQQIENYQTALTKLDFKIERYNEAIRTGVLSFDSKECES